MTGFIPTADNGVTVAVLAAGSGKRFGGGKLDALCAGRPLGQWVVEAVREAGLAPGVIVTGPKPPQFAIGLGDWNRVTVEGPETGMAASLQAAARTAAERGSQALLVLLADMPLLDPDFLLRLIRTTAPAATRHPEGRPGVPAIIPHRLFCQIERLSGDQGASAILATQNDLQLLDAPAGMLLDVDRREDLQSVEAMLQSIQTGPR